MLLKGYSFTWSNIKRNILHDMGRTATTGEFKDGSFKIKLTSSDKVSKYSVFFKDKKFELGKFTFNFSRETYSIPEKLVKFFNVTKTMLLELGKIRKPFQFLINMEQRL